MHCKSKICPAASVVGREGSQDITIGGQLEAKTRYKRPLDPGSIEPTSTLPCKEGDHS